MKHFLPDPFDEQPRRSYYEFDKQSWNSDEKDMKHNTDEEGLESSLMLSEKYINHPFHQHPMSLVKNFFKDRVVCYACQSSCLGSPTYACTRCKYFLHKRCADCPYLTKVIHPSHPSHHLHVCVDHEKQITCKSCERNVCSFILSCSECNWNMCIECYLLPKHLNQYYFHSDHPNHPNLTRLISTSSSKFTCSTCHLSFESGTSRFLCTACGFVVDVDCALMPSITIEGQGCFKHFNHPHPLMLVMDDATRDGEILDVRCFACDSPCKSGLAYFSCTKCKYFLHKLCAELPLKIRHAIHTCHPFLTLLESHTELVTNPLDEYLLENPLDSHVISKSFFCCSTCQRKINPSAFLFQCCNRSCNFMICVRCIYENPIIKHERQLRAHHLCFVKEVPQILECNAYDGYCKIPVTSVELCTTEYSMFCCTHCDFNLHLLCGPLPSTIKYKYHIHPLILIDSVVEDDSGKYYCDICETERDSRIRVYCCQECKYFAHIHCLISEVITALRSGHEELKTVKINYHKGKEVDSGAILKFKDITTNLPEDEKAVFESNFKYTSVDCWNPSFTSTPQLPCYNRQYFDRLVGWLNGFYGFERQESKYTNLKGEFVVVEGYMISRKLARILVLVLRNYGDISSLSESTLEMKSITFFLLCQVLHSMSTTKVRDITIDHLKEWYFYLNFAQRRGFSVEFITEKLNDVVRAFLGMRAVATRNFERDIERVQASEILNLKKELDDFLKSRSHSS